MTTSTTTTTKISATAKQPSPAKGNPAVSFRDQLLAEEPRLDAALKSFCSWLVASASTASPLDTHHHHNNDENEHTDSTELPAWTLAAALICTRHLSKAINAHIVPIQYDSSTEPIATPEQLMREVTARVWNEVAAQPGTKITKVLGRTALQYVWKDLDLTALTSTSQGATYCQTFHQLLMENKSTTTTNNNAISDAAVLIWGSPQAVARRAAERQATAAARVKEEQASRLKQAITSHIIEELPEEDEEDTKPAAIE
uniref:Uncharacterized protein n=1 Tax=Amphora coffeiformis TaxID=265554 RepID=A0A7S3P217_9STRA|mmetsp:Transcript_4233/g.8608  ORF Transcript_4233/g.8608 Transcript_4233/m.8608 type:complete len:257 (+) Transcript_4233:397-1167(+)|eukprot:scaffold5950_cov263-Amphora_coffeaeformis.AAC.4